MDESAPAAPAAEPKKKPSLGRRLAKLALKLAVSGGLVYFFASKLAKPTVDEVRPFASDVAEAEAETALQEELAGRASALARTLREEEAVFKASRRAGDAALVPVLAGAAAQLEGASDALSEGRAADAHKAVLAAVDLLEAKEIGLADKFLAILSGVRWKWFGLAFFLPFFGFAFGTMRWKILMRAQGPDIPFRKLYLSYFQATFFNIFLPGVYGGDVVRIYDSAKYTGKGTTSAMVVIIERLIGGVALTFIASAAFGVLYLLNPEAELLKEWKVFLLIFGVLVAILICSNPRVARWGLKTFGRFLPAKVRAFAEQAYAAVETYYRKPKYLLAALAVGFFFEFNVAVYYYFILHGLGQDIPFVQCMTIVPVMILLMMIVPTINGIGMRAWTLSNLMRVPAGIPLAFELVDIAMRVLMGLMGGVIFLVRRGPQRIKEIAAEAAPEAPAAPPAPAPDSDG